MKDSGSQSLSEAVSLGNTKARRFVEELESLRGIAAVIVIFYHLPKWVDLDSIGIIRNGHLMVPVFFVLSGYVIYTAYRDSLNSMIDVFRFQFVRLGRIYPLHVFFLLVFFVFEISKWFADNYFGIVGATSKAFQVSNAKAFYQNVLLIHGVLPNNPLTFNGPSWSISVEAFLYMTFAFIVIFANKYAELVFFGTAAGSLFLLFSENSFGFSTLINGYAGFFLGCLAGALLRTERIWVPEWLSATSLFMLIIFLSLNLETRYFPIVYLLSLLCVMSIVGCRSSAINVALRNKILVYLGTISYSLYMSHAAVIWFVSQVLRVGLQYPSKTTSGGASIPDVPHGIAILSYVVIIILIVLVSTITYKYIEMPMRKRSRDLWDSLT